MKGRGINNLPEFLDSSPSPQPSPIKGEGVFLTFYEIINLADFSLKFCTLEENSEIMSSGRSEYIILYRLLG
jgi:hypothetical protein